MTKDRETKGKFIGNRMIMKLEKAAADTAN